MTDIRYHIGYRCSVTIEGHACAKRHNGNDLCCAAESMLACTLVNALQKLPLSGKYIYVTDGLVKVSFCTACPGAIVAVAIVKAVIDGFEMLSEQYPENVNICKRRKNKHE